MTNVRCFWLLCFIGSICMASTPDFSVYKARRAELISKIQQEHKKTSGAIMLCASFEEHDIFVQESSFYYFTGIKEPGAVCLLDLSGRQKLYIPNCVTERAKWMHGTLTLDQETADMLGFDEITTLGDQCAGYQIYPFSLKKEYASLVDQINAYIASGEVIFTTLPKKPFGYIHQRLLILRLMQWCNDLSQYLVDCSDIIAAMRRIKSKLEIEYIFKAVAITAEAQEAAAQAIADGVNESEVQAGLEYMMVAQNARKSFPSIVGSGPNSTVLHYHENNRIMRNGDLVVVDIGASYKGYAADITRTYPVSGEFTERQKEIYELVLEVQEYIASIAQPGYYLRNKEHQEKSLHHLAIKFLEERGYGNYMPHGLGHYLGLDVHDVGSYDTPLVIGDVFTIEPGIYIADEQLGIRIEDDYWMTEKGVLCLSEDIPKSIKDIESLVKQKFS